jgi:hypothetical protein
VLWIFFHLPLAMSIALCGGGFGEALVRTFERDIATTTLTTSMALANTTATAALPSHVGVDVYRVSVAYLIAGGAGGSLISLGLIGIVHHSIEHLSIDWRYRVTLRVIAGAVVCALPLVANTYVSVGGCAAAIIVLVLVVELGGVSLVAWRHRRAVKRQRRPDREFDSARSEDESSDFCVACVTQRGLENVDASRKRERINTV